MRYVSILLLVLSVNNVFSKELWQKIYGSQAVDYATCIIKTFDEGFAVLGYKYTIPYATNYDICLLKLYPDGSLQWTKTFGGANEDNANCMIQTNDSGYVVAGSTKSFGQGYEDILIVKFNSAGELLWARTIGGAEMDMATTLKQTSDGGYVLAGYSASHVVNGLMIVKITENGNIEWSKIADNVSDGWMSSSIVLSADGGYGIACTIDSVLGRSDMCFIKLNELGLLQWSWVIGGTEDDQAFSVSQTGDHGYALAGFSNTFGAGSPDLYIVKLSVGGTLEWTRTIGGWNDDYAISIMNSLDGNLIVAGEGATFGNGWFDMYLMKLDTRGRLLWSKTIGGPEIDVMRSIVTDNEGGFIAVGRTYSFGSGESDMFLVKTDSVGNTCGYATTPDPHIDSGGTLLKIPVNLFDFTPIVSSVGLNMYTGNTFATLCLTETQPSSDMFPESFSLQQNYPNPFNPITRIKFEIPNSSNTKIMIYDVLGKLVTSLVNKQLKPGSYEVEWDGSWYASGVYFYSLVTDEFVETKRMVLIK
jgi:Secretion system C-terminal sorting domain